MDSKTLIKALKTAVREVIKEELSEILREGLQSTITEMQRPQTRYTSQPAARKQATQFADNRYANILNQTDPLEEHRPLAMNSFADLVNEGMDEIRMTSRDAQGFGMMRQQPGRQATPQIMEDPETGRAFEVAPEVAAAMTRDYSALLKAMDKKKGG
jgi:hypothetical protein